LYVGSKNMVEKAESLNLVTGHQLLTTGN
jgi:hypothetical protein